MPSRQRTLTPHGLRRFVDDHCFAPTSADSRVGVEVEWLPVDLAHPAEPLPPGPVPGLGATEAAAVMPAGSRITLEPGGQVELSSPPLRGIGPACAALAADAATLTHELADGGVGLVGVGFDPRPDPPRRVHGPRYDAMEAYFDSQCDAGRTMMRATAAVQVNVDLGPDRARADTRWRRAHDLGPTLAGAFANSPIGAGAWPSGWRSRRLAVWSDIDAGRTASAGGDDDCRVEWSSYVLDARVMLIRRDERRYVPIVEPLTFAQWIDRGHDLGYPTVGDLEYHLTTLFPPVRPRGWLELRMIDALPDPWWRAAVAVATTLVADDEAAEACAAAVAPTRGMWREAARHGLDHPQLASSARACFEAALDALSRLGSDAATISAVAAFHDRYSARGRCPADDRLAEWAEDGTVLPGADRFVELTWA